MSKQDLGRRIRKRRRELDLTQKALAKLCGFPYQVLSHLENGDQDIYAQRLKVIAEHLGVSADFLLGIAQPSRHRAKHTESNTSQPGDGPADTVMVEA